ncbi:MAG: Gfo/Idh/MocA family protein [Luteolibacter sp.]
MINRSIQDANIPSRRLFIKHASAAALAPLILRSGLLGAEAPSKQFRIGAIGTGRMGRGDISNALAAGLKANASVVAVCDVDRKRAKSAAEMIGKFRSERKLPPIEIQIYHDCRELLAREDIDGVTISTPDHSHAWIATAAADAGKAIYLQKPLTYTIPEGQELVKAVRRNKVTLQTGTQQRSSIYFRQVCNIVRNQWLGKLVAVEVEIPSDSGVVPFTKMPVPDHLDYTAWLQPAAAVDYTEAGVHPQHDFSRPGWLQRAPFCHGMVTGWGAHMFDIAQWGIGCDADSGPVEVTCNGEFPDRGIFDVHVGFQGSARYANGVMLSSKNGNPGVKFIMEDGWAYCNRGKMDCSNKELLRRKPTSSEVQLAESRDHMLDFLTAAREGRDPVAPVEVGHRSNSLCILHHISMKLGGRTLQWDPVK